MNAVRILIADDQVMAREGLRQLIQSQPGLDLVAEATDSRSIRQQTEEHSPEISLIAVTMEKIDVCAVIRETTEQSPSTKVVAVGVPDSCCDLSRLLRTGARGYVSRRAGPDELVEAITVVARGDIYVDPRNAEQLFVLTTLPQPGPDGAQLSSRETKILRLLAEGFSNKEISARLGFSATTVHHDKANAMAKLGLHSRVELVQYATAGGWLPTL